MFRCPSCATLVALASLACGGKSYVIREGEDDGGSSSLGGRRAGHAGDGAAPAGGDLNVGGVGGSAGVGSSSSQNGGVSASGSSAGGVDGDACASFDDDAETAVKIELVNKTSRTLYIGNRSISCGTTPLFNVESEHGEALTIINDCRVPCESLHSDNPSGGCAALCQQPTLLIMNPGATYPATWSGLEYVGLELPSACSQSGSAGACDRAHRIRPGTFVFTAEAGTKADCANAPECDYCPLSRDVCGTQGGLVGGATLTATATVALDERYGVYGENPTLPPVNPRSVQLVFTE